MPAPTLGFLDGFLAAPASSSLELVCILGGTDPQVYRC